MSYDVKCACSRNVPFEWCAHYNPQLHTRSARRPVLRLNTSPSYYLGKRITKTFSSRIYFQETFHSVPPTIILSGGIFQNFTCRNCGGGDRGRVAIYRPFGEVSLSLNRTVTCMVLKANDRRTSCPCHDEFLFSLTRGGHNQGSSLGDEILYNSSTAIGYSNPRVIPPNGQSIPRKCVRNSDLAYIQVICDEAHFWLNGYVNKQNCRIWSEANPQVYVETPLHPEKLTVWCALSAGGIIGPYFFKNDEGHNVTVNGDRYTAMITNFFIPELNNHDVQELWFQQDGATWHTARATIDLLKDTFGDRLISHFGPMNWPPRSCDLTPLDYFLWGYVKSLVFG
ncbi:uncharacterized protein TNCV_244131 [Trichonephila clavipes]|uniref:Transposase n=1 Tax=Trichonephila clavipes TaxID=2585209 RepID=A0A8X6RJT6_TRICX|nr:uncharacterized protein TNCV_244131 [Trichonephila clavipes]